MKDSRMVLASDFCPNRRQRAVDQASRHIHGNLPCLNYLALACLREKVVAGDVEIITDNFLHLVYRHIYLFLTYDLVSYAFSKIYCNLTMCQGRSESCIFCMI